MGAYIYTMRAKNINIEIEGEAVKANLLKYAFKPYAFMYEDEQPKQFKMMLGRAEQYWKRKETPEYFAVGDSFENGCSVYKGWPKGKAWAYDEPDFPGEFIGWLKKVGKKFVISKSYIPAKFDEGHASLINGEWVQMCNVGFTN